MAQDQHRVYRKYNSFVGLKVHHDLEQPLPRIRHLYKTLPQVNISEERKKVVRQACEEILGLSKNLGEPSPFTLHPNVIDEINQLSDEELPRYFHFRYRYEIYPQRKILDAYPPLVQIEPASICNYRCVFCYQTDGTFTSKESGQMGFMSLDLFKSVIDQTEGHCEAVTLASRGEPLSCPSIKEMLAYIRGKFLCCKLNTNAWFLDEAKCHAICQADMQVLVFSADAAAEPAYSQFRVGGKLERVVENIRRFHDIRQKHYPNSRMITRVSGVKVPGTPNLDEMEKFWGDLVDQVAFVAYNPWENTYEQPFSHVKEACSDLWRRTFIWWDGNVNPCDVDYKSKLAIGQIQEQSLTNLWLSRNYMQLRAHHMENQRSECYPCNRCIVV